MKKTRQGNTKIALVLSAVILTGILLAACASSSSTPAWTGPVTTVYIGHHYPIEMASFRDDIADLRREQRQDVAARRYAEKEVLNKLGVKIEWVQYSDLPSEILTGVSDGRKFDMVRIVGAIQGQLIGSGLLKPIDDYASLFSDEDSAWMYWPQVFNHNYFLNMQLRGGPDAPLCYNIGKLNKVPALKDAEGKTILPIHLWQQGKWTWSAFEDYLQKVNDYWVAEWDGNIAWDSDHKTAALCAIYANGGRIYGDDGLGFASQESKDAVAFIDRLMAKRLLRNPDIKAGTSEQDGVMDIWRFQWGHSVFCNLQQWLAMDMVNSFNERREKMGIVPFPRPDWIEAGDPAYQQANDARDCYAVPANVPADRAELAIKAFREYTLAFYKNLAESERALDFLQGEEGAKASAARWFIDIDNRDYGPVMLEAWKSLGSEPQINEYAKNVGIWDYWGTSVLGDSLYSINGATPYETWADTMLPQVQAKIDETAKGAGVVPAPAAPATEVPAAEAGTAAEGGN